MPSASPTRLTSPVLLASADAIRARGERQAFPTLQTDVAELRARLRQPLDREPLDPAGAAALAVSVLESVPPLLR